MSCGGQINTACYLWEGAVTFFSPSPNACAFQTKQQKWINRYPYTSAPAIVTSPGWPSTPTSTSASVFWIKLSTSCSPYCSLFMWVDEVTSNRRSIPKVCLLQLPQKKKINKIMTIDSSERENPQPSSFLFLLCVCVPTGGMGLSQSHWTTTSIQHHRNYIQ